MSPKDRADGRREEGLLPEITTLLSRVRRARVAEEVASQRRAGVFVSLYSAMSCLCPLSKHLTMGILGVL